jgi:hypothetical protein
VDDTKATVDTLAFTATTANGEVLEFNLPLHPHTHSPEQVGTLIEAILETVSQRVEGAERFSDGDVLQALTLALAVRLKVADMPTDTARQLVEALANFALQGFEGGTQVSSASTRH